MFNIGYKENEMVTHEELCSKTNIGCMGGIRYSRKNNVLILFMKPGSKFDNSWEGNVLKYMGQGNGDQSIKLMNKRLAESSIKDTLLFLFEWVDSIYCKFIGRMVLDGEPYYEIRTNKDGRDERKLFFPLKKAD